MSMDANRLFRSAKEDPSAFRDLQTLAKRFGFHIEDLQYKETREHILSLYNRNRIFSLNPDTDRLDLCSLDKEDFFHICFYFRKASAFHCIYSEIEDISPLKYLENIDSLYLAKNRISDLNPIKNLKRLRWLALEDNNISDLSPLFDCPQLEGIYLRGNPLLTKNQIEELKEKLPYCLVE